MNEVTKNKIYKISTYIFYFNFIIFWILVVFLVKSIINDESAAMELRTDFPIKNYRSDRTISLWVNLGVSCGIAVISVFFSNKYNPN